MPGQLQKMEETRKQLLETELLRMNKGVTA